MCDFSYAASTSIKLSEIEECQSLMWSRWAGQAEPTGVWRTIRSSALYHPEGGSILRLPWCCHIYYHRQDGKLCLLIASERWYSSRRSWQQSQTKNETKLENCTFGIWRCVDYLLSPLTIEWGYLMEIRKLPVEIKLGILFSFSRATTELPQQ